MSKVSDFVFGGKVKTEVIQNATGVVTLDFSKNVNYVVNQGNGNLTLDFTSQSDSKSSGRLELTRNLNFSISFSSVEVIDEENLLVDFAAYNNKSFFVGNEDNSFVGIYAKPNGSNFYVVGTQTDRVYEYRLSTPFDLNVCNYNGVNKPVGNEDGNPGAITFSPDGTKMFMVGSTTDNVYQYSMSLPFRLTLLNYDNVSFSVAGQVSVPNGITFDDTGMKFYVFDSTSDTLYQYSTTSPYDISNASYDNVSFSFSGNVPTPAEAVFNLDGTKLFVSGGSEIHRYSLSSPFDISTLVSDNVFLNVDSEDANMTAIALMDNDSKFLAVGSAEERVYEYSLAKESTISEVFVNGNSRKLVSKFVNYDDIIIQ